MMKKQLAYLLAFLLAMFALPQSVIHASSAPEFTLSISKESIKAGDDFQVTVNGKQLTDMYAYEVNLTFDSSRLKFVKSVSQSGGFSVSPVVSGDKIQIAHTQIGKNPGQQGNVTLATITLHAIAQGTANIELNSVKLVNSQLVSSILSSNEKVSAKVKGGIDTIVLKPEVKFNATTKTATSNVDAAAWVAAQSQAESDPSGKQTIHIEVGSVAGATTYVQQLPSAVISSDKKQYQIEIKTPIASLIVSSNMFQGSNMPDSQSEIHIAQVDPNMLNDSVQNKVGSHPVIELTIQSGGETIPFNNPKAPVTVSIPYSPTSEEIENPEHIVVWYIDGQGEIHAVHSGKYNATTGQVTFTTTHFSTYAISFVQKSFDDLSSVSWAKVPVEVLASKGIINGTSDSEFSPTQQVTRADFLVLLVRTLELQGPMGERFADVEEGAYYDEALRLARGMGITNGSGDDLFLPNASITREDMMVLTERALRMGDKQLVATSAAELSTFTDASSVSNYAINSIDELVKAGLINGYDNKINPKGTTTRAEAATLMYGIYNY